MSEGKLSCSTFQFSLHMAIEFERRLSFQFLRLCIRRSFFFSFLSFNKQKTDKLTGKHVMSENYALLLHSLVRRGPYDKSCRKEILSVVRRFDGFRDMEIVG